MNILNFYPHYSSGVEPDELTWILAIANNVGEKLKNYDANLVITNNFNINLPKDKKNFVILSNEHRGELSDKNFEKCFLTFHYNFNEKYLPFPLGLNKFVFKEFLKNSTKINFFDREYDVFFAGYSRPNREQMLFNAHKLKCKKFIYTSTINNLQNFDNDLNPEQYISIAKNSKIILAPPGSMHPSTYRYFESIFTESLVICVKNTEQIFYEDENPLTIKLENWDELTDTLVNNKILEYNTRKQKFENFYNTLGGLAGVTDYVIKEILK